MIERNSMLAAAAFVPERMVFPDAWCGHLPFAAWLIGVLRPRQFVELGTHTGNSYFGFCQAVALHGTSTRCYAVDTWAGDEHAGHYDEEVYRAFLDFHDARYASFSTPLRMTFDKALGSIGDRSIDLLHVDGLHTYEAVRHDFETWLPKLAPGAIVLLHDTCVREREFGVWKFWSELRERYPATLEFRHSNGLGVLQVGERPGSTLAWLGAASREQELIRDYFTALGESMLERYRAREQSDLAQRLRAENAAQAALIDQIQRTLSLVSAERDATGAHIAAMRRTVSWRVTAPLRFAQHLLRGNTGIVRNMVDDGLTRIGRRLALSVTNRLRKASDRLFGIIGVLPNSSSNFAAIADIVALRCAASSARSGMDPLCPPHPLEWPEIDIGVVTYNNGGWVDAFVDSLLAMDYPCERITVRFVDNSSTDNTPAVIERAGERLHAAGFRSEVIRQPNHGYGSGHNTAIRAGRAPFCLVTNVDLTFERSGLRYIVAAALADDARAAAWEFRQKPYEHPKFYDPVTGLTNWNTGACVLYRRSAIDPIGGFDETLFMYGEDVELSYRLRREGHRLRYCPRAAVWHYSYQDVGKVKPIQYSGSTFANLYLRLKYGNLANMMAIPLMATRLLLAPQVYPGSRLQVLNNMARLALVAPKAMASRRSSIARFPFRVWDYELSRDGAFVAQHPMPEHAPLVSVITRTYRGRELLLRQAILSVAHQTWPNVEHVVVEDGGDSLGALCDELAATTGGRIVFVPNGKHGRSSTGNRGMEAASGRWCLFLDDDDLLFADHVETLATELMVQPDAVASYSLAWEIVTDLGALAHGSYRELSRCVPAPLRQEFDYDVLQHHNFMAIQSVLFERILFIDRGGLEEDMDALEDWILWIRYAYGERFAYVPKITSMFRTPSDPATIQQRIDAFRAAYPLALARAKAWIDEYRRTPPAKLHDQVIDGPAQGILE